jgi:hypothetical protein
LWIVLALASRPKATVTVVSTHGGVNATKLAKMHNLTEMLLDELKSLEFTVVSHIIDDGKHPSSWKQAKDINKSAACAFWGEVLGTVLELAKAGDELITKAKAKFYVDLEAIKLAKAFAAQAINA